MSEPAKQGDLPFHAFTFTLVADKRPRALFRMRAQDDGTYELHVEKGSASNPTSQFTRAVPLEVAERLRDALQGLGAFGWEESYGDASAPGSRRWSMTTVFREGVFSVSSKGGSDAPAGFDDLLEELYRLDFPRPDAVKAQGAPAGQGMRLGTALNSLGSLGIGSMGGLSAGDMGAYGAVGKGGFGDIDFSKLGDAFGGGDLANLFADAQGNPQALQQRLREEFRHMSPEEQNQLLDMLASSGMASRSWWERFLRGW